MNWERLVYRGDPIRRTSKGPATTKTHDEAVDLVRENAPVPEAFFWVCTKCNKRHGGGAPIR